MIAKFAGGVGILFAIALVSLGVAQINSNATVAQIWQTLQTHPLSAERFSQEMVASQPEPVQRYFAHAIATGTPLATSVRLTMSGTIRLAPGGDWLPLQAEEILSTQGFVWKARAGQGVLHMQGADYYTHGNGRMRFSLWGLIPVVNTQNPDVTRSAIGRWIGEYFWLPSALLPQRGVSWRAIDETTIQASLKADGQPLTLTLKIDQQGRVLSGSLLRWGNQTQDKHYAEIPFGGNHLAERTFGGYTIPSQMGAGWSIGTDHYFEFFRVTIDHAEFLYRKQATSSFLALS